MTPALIWQSIPAEQELAAALLRYPQAACIFLSDDFSGSLQQPGKGYLKTCAAPAANFIPAHTNPLQRDLYLLPASAAETLQQYGFGTLLWQNRPPAPQQPCQNKPWQIAPPPLPIERVLIIGGGIAGATTAHALARRGIESLILEQEAQPARAGSGNRQGLLYAKISAHPTLQTRLLLGSYGYSRRLLEHVLPASPDWQPCGVLHLNHNEGETRRNRQLAAKSANRHLYHAVSAAEAAALAGIPLAGQDGLFWPQGAWLNPPAFAAALLESPRIRLLTRHRLTGLQRHGKEWRLAVNTPQGEQIFSGSHIIFCCGAEQLADILPEALPLQFIRGQTSLAGASPFSRRLRCALSADGYISPEYLGQHCFGASFVPNSRSSAIVSAEDDANHAKLARLSPELAAALPNYQAGHAAVRADCYDHLPAVGALGDWAAMRLQYAKLAHDKNYPLPEQPCPHLPGLFANSGHGSRGLATAPLCGELVAAQMLGQPLPAEPKVAAALAPNRLLIRQIIHHQTAL
ncbi:FAD-dependent 5-carboxymethylaminomethyl-2-thiouridine(34) oxidoreductase MnmC [Eikenella sp. Marseille-P7795]|uniref:FAD-dependent 5-carboxymethylaminomethyl-2-thiouridine(34) oxidoreductase MnmC n=1 Tax=Eikenella sp. Marseille-P7795 TaxID=2866577 RepID=UPI001CE4306B|nr:FAD-dependent 5-carboxymethylaminomethyl-2-thiouridine(34) oxidoreductase MnmC [Eikenella sp. Marseille-P7795]